MYLLYTANNCHQCASVIKFMEDNDFKFTQINVDEEEKMPPIIIYAFPALFKDEELLAYGNDIKNYLQKNSNLV